MQEPLLDIENLSISFTSRAGDIPAVEDFSCQIYPGETMGIVGESGCGKSTVALAIMQDLGANGRIVGGTIRFRGEDMLTMTTARLRSIRGATISMVYQEPMASLNPTMKIGMQLMEVPMIHEGLSKREAKTRVLAILDAVRLPDPKRIFSSYPHQLSGGQQQRIIIAMALLAKPSLLLMDEPTTALDVTVEASIIDLIKTLSKEFGTALLFISHNLGLVRETCDRITVMYSGEAVETGSLDDIFTQTRHPYTQGLFRSIPTPSADKISKPLIAIPGQLPLPRERPVGCNFGTRCEHFKEDVCNIAEIAMQTVSKMDGGEIQHASRCLRIADIDWQEIPVHSQQSNITASKATIPAEPFLHVENLKKYYTISKDIGFGSNITHTIKANESISFEAHKGETVAIVGESGCGKSTLAKILLGLETASDGTVTLNKEPIGDTSIEDRNVETVRSVQMVFQNPFNTLNPSHSVGSQIIRTLEKFEIGQSPDERYQRMLELLDLVHLPRQFEHRMPRQLSGGQKQRIGIARAFAGEPQLIVADEPVSALDVSVQAAVTELLIDIQQNAQTTMVFISHDLSVVRYIADRIVVMYLGHVIEEGSTNQVFSPPYHPYTEALLSAIPLVDPNFKKQSILLEGDIPSALNPPTGCPFQTRCARKHKAPAGLCENQLPPMRDMGKGHIIMCHLGEDVLATMEPVITPAEAA